MRGGVNIKINKDAIIEEMKNTDDMALVSAYLYAKGAIEYGVNVLETWNTAVKNSYNLEKAYEKGYYEGLQKASVNKSVLEDIKAEIDELPSELTYDGRRMVRRSRVFEIIDNHISGKEQGENT